MSAASFSADASYNSAAAESALQFTGTNIPIVWLSALNVSSGLRFIWVFDTAAGSTAGAPACMPLPVLPNSYVCLPQMPVYGNVSAAGALRLASGLYIATSISGVTFDAAGVGSDVRFDVRRGSF